MLRRLLPKERYLTVNAAHRSAGGMGVDRRMGVSVYRRDTADAVAPLKLRGKVEGGSAGAMLAQE